MLRATLVRYQLSASGVVLLLEVRLAQVARRDLRGGVGRVGEGGQELLLARLALARADERRGQVVAHVDVVGIELERPAKGRDRRLPLALGRVGEAQALLEVGVLAVLLDRLLELLERQVDTALAQVHDTRGEAHLGLGRALREGAERGHQDSQRHSSRAIVRIIISFTPWGAGPRAPPPGAPGAARRRSAPGCRSGARPPRPCAPWPG